MEGHRYISNETNFYMRQPFQGFPWIKTPRKRCIISTAQSQMFSKLKSVTLRRYKYLVLGRDSSYFAKRTKEKKHSDSPKSSLKLISSTCSSFWLTTYLLYLVDVFFNRQSPYLWVQTVLLFSPTCSLIRMRQTSYRSFSRKTKRS